MRKRNMIYRRIKDYWGEITAIEEEKAESGVLYTWMGRECTEEPKEHMNLVLAEDRLT